MTPRGTANKRAKLTDDDVLAIRYRSQFRGETIRSLAECFEVSKSQIHKIVTGANWPHLVHSVHSDSSILD